MIITIDCRETRISHAVSPHHRVERGPSGLMGFVAQRSCWLGVASNCRKLEKPATSGSAARFAFHPFN
jgi:hypothetical protein